MKNVVLEPARSQADRHAPSRRRSGSRIAIAVCTMVATFLLVASSSSAPAAAEGVVGVGYYVSPTGSDFNSGTSVASPLRLIQTALNKVQPGDTVNLAPGVYREKLTTMRSGGSGAPITIKGPETGKDRSGRYRAVLYGTSRIVNVDHSYYVFDGFTIDGQEQLANTAYPTTVDQVRAFKDSVQAKVADGRLIYVGSADTSRDITGVVIRNMFLNGGGGECVRLRNNAHHNEILDSVIQWCGMYGKGDDVARYKYHNAEGVYIGTSPKSTTQPMFANDTSSSNAVRNTTIHTFGSECFNTKENSHDNTLENSDCRYNEEPLSFDGSNIELRGDHNSLIGNTIAHSRGWNLKLRSDSSQYDLGGNSAQRNAFAAAGGPAILNDQTSIPGLYCGNTFSSTNILDGTSVGDPKKPCPTDITADTVRPTVSITSPVDGATVSGSVAVTVAASDNVGVAKVDLLVDGALQGTRTAVPYTFDWAPPASGSHSLVARATDAAGNVGSSPSVTVTATAPPDTAAPTVPAGLSAVAVSPTRVDLSWQPSTDAVGVTGYSISRNAALLTTTATTASSDTTVVASSSYTYTVVAFDAAGNRSAASLAVTVTTPAATVGNVVGPIEAESGSVAGGMVVVDDATASGGRHVAGRSSGTVTFTMDVPSAGRYMIAGYTKAPNGSSNSFTVKVDASSKKTWDLKEPTTSWVYDAAGNPAFDLSAGRHTVVIGFREAGALVDRVALVRQ